MTSINGLLANERQDTSALKWAFSDSRVLVRKLASAFGHPTNASLYASSTCAHLRLLAGPFDQGLKVGPIYAALSSISLSLSLSGCLWGRSTGYSARPTAAINQAERPERGGRFTLSLVTIS